MSTLSSMSEQILVNLLKQFVEMDLMVALSHLNL